MALYMHFCGATLVPMWLYGPRLVIRKSSKMLASLCTGSATDAKCACAGWMGGKAALKASVCEMVAANVLRPIILSFPKCIWKCSGFFRCTFNLYIYGILCGYSLTCITMQLNDASAFLADFACKRTLTSHSHTTFGIAVLTILPNTMVIVM